MHYPEWSKFNIFSFSFIMCGVHEDGMKNMKVMIIFTTSKTLWDKQRYYILSFSFIYVFQTYPSPLKTSHLDSILGKHVNFE